jgi:hypothetical protein
VKLAAAVAAALCLAASATGSAGRTVTITSARPPLLRSNEQLSLLGAISPGRVGEAVLIEAKYCGEKLFQRLAAVPTGENGAWSTKAYVGKNATVRARWGDAVSNTVQVQARAHVTLGITGPSTFRADVGFEGRADGKYVLLQRYDSRAAAWRTVRKIALKGEGYAVQRFRATFPKGTLIRLVLPREVAGPCYLAGYSNLMRI